MWFRWHEGTSSDPKLHLIARKSGQPVAFVLASWAMLLERASAAEVRGDVGGFDCESADAALGMPDGAAQAIYDAMVAKGMIVDGRVAKWETRQPTSTERVREYRAKVKRQEAQCNAVKRQETQETLKIREEYIKPPLPPHGGGECDLHASGEEDPGPPDDPKARPQGGGPFLVAKSGRVLAGKAVEDFERFWTDFGLSRGKAEAADAWLDLPDMTDALVARICEAAKLEAADRPRLEGKGQKPKMARGWLTSRRWEDYAPIKPREPDKEPSFGGEFDEEKWRKAQEMRRKLASRMASG